MEYVTKLATEWLSYTFSSVIRKGRRSP